MPERDRTHALRVVDRQVVAHDQDVVALTLAAADGKPLPRWFPGAHIDINLPSGLVRQYSLNGDPAVRDSYRIAVRRIPAGGGGSIEVHDKLTVGATVTTSGPRNAFPLSMPGHGSPTQRFRFIAGGIGITPILPMLRQAQRLGVDWSMVYVGRTPDSLPFVDEVSRFGDRVEIRTDDVHGLPTADDLLGGCPDGTAVYACGPAPMLTAIRTRARRPRRRRIALRAVRRASGGRRPGVLGVHRIHRQRSSTSAREETLLSALQRSGVPASYSCQQGFCGTCRTRVLGGDVDHRDTLLTDPERNAGTMLVCVSRAPEGERLTLDL